MASIQRISGSSPNFAISSPKAVPAKPAGLPQDGGDSLSLESRVELSQKIGTAPAPPPVRKPEKPSTAKALRAVSKAPEAPEKGEVRTTDSLGRICTGSLHGPLLMEEAGASYLSEASFSSEGFRYDNAVDFHNLKEASKALATLSSPELGLEQDPGYLYVGTIDGFANLVKDEPSISSEGVSGGAIMFPDGRYGHISRSSRNGGEIRVRVPEESLDMLADWGRTLIAIA